MNEIRNILRKFLKTNSPPASLEFQKKSYSQCGEDLIMDFYCRFMVERPILSYLDIGANHPFWINNTAIFYEQGISGVCVDPSAESQTLFQKSRPNDSFLNAAVGAITENDRTLYIMEPNTLTTMNKQEAEAYVREKGHTLVREESINVTSLNDLIDTYFDGIGPTIMNIDIEGVEHEVMSNFSYAERSPLLVCMETIGYVSQKHDQDLVELIRGNGYEILATTPINTIFVRTH